MSDAAEFEGARQALRSGDAATAAAVARAIVIRRPDDVGAALLLIEASAALGIESDGIALASRTLECVPDADELRWRLAVAMHRSNQLEAAIASYEELRRRMGHAGLLYNLGLAYQALGRLAEAASEFEQLLQRHPGHADGHMALATIREELGFAGAALNHYREAIRLAPGHWIAHHNLGWLLRRSGDLAGAVGAFQDAVAVAPERLEAQFGLGTCLAALDRYQEAVGPLERAVMQRPDYTEALANLGAVYRGLRRPQAAIAVLRQALAINPDQPGARNNLAMCYRDLGMIDEMLRELRAALVLRPDDPEIHSNLIFNLQYDPSATGESLLAEARSWARRFTPKDVPVREFARPADRQRLRIGYLSADFRNHAAGFFLEPLIAAHDRDAVEIVCYFDHLVGDDVTERIRSLVPAWRDTRRLDDSALGDLIRNDDIDILVECGGHTGGNRLAVLAGRVAPVQVTTLLGHGGTSGLDTIDYILADAALVPDADQRHFSETVIRLPFFAPFMPRSSWPEVSALPEGFPVFACVADPARISPAIISVWRDLLDAVPDAEIVLKHWVHGEADLQDHWRQRYAGLGERVRWEGVPGGWTRNQTFYERVWAVLDTWPANGASSSLIPLWMGVPVINLSGLHCGQRFGRSLLSAAGLPHLVAETPADYVRIAADLVADRKRLAVLRHDLRDRMARSLVCDGPRIVRALEEAYRGMWRKWRDRNGSGAVGR